MLQYWPQRGIYTKFAAKNMSLQFHRYLYSTHIRYHRVSFEVVKKVLVRELKTRMTNTLSFNTYSFKNLVIISKS